VTFGFVEAEKANYPISVMCAVLGVSESGFHDWRTRPPSRRQSADAALVGIARGHR
jgi:putative transposase